MSDIEEKTKIPLTWAAIIVSTVIGLAFNAGMAHFRLQSLETEWDKFRVREEDHRKLDSEHDLKIQSLDINMANIANKLTSIDGRLERIQEKMEKR